MRQLASLLLPAVVLVVVPLLIEDDFGIYPDAFAVAGAVFCLLGLLMIVSTIKMFIEIGRGTLAPWDPTQQLVTRGLYARVRNPMIAGVLSALIGEALVFHSMPIFVWSVVFFMVNYVYFIAFEEPDLVERFGDEYVEYKKNVPRWIPRLREWRPEENRTKGV